MAILRTITKIVGWLLLVLLSLYVMLLLVNWQDEAPSTAAIELQSIQQQVAVPADNNGYVYYVQRNHDLRSQLPTTVLDLLQCQQQDCNQMLAAHQEELTELLTLQQPLLEFYLQLHSFEFWQEPIPAQSVQFPPYQPLLNAQRLHLLQAWLAAQQHDLASTRLLLQQDLAFWRRVLRHNNSLLSKMISVSAIERHFSFGQQIIQSLEPQQQEAVLPDNWLHSFDESELDFKRPLAGEWSYANALITDMLQATPTDSNVSWSDWLLMQLTKPFFKQQATSNEYISLLLSKLDGSEPTPVHWYHWLYNPAGKLLNRIGSLDISRYRDSLNQLESSRRDALQTLAEVQPNEH